jgi:hypothetical protein
MDTVIPSDLVNAVKKGECVLFLGAGVHYPPPKESSYAYPEEQRPPLGEKFSNDLADECIAQLNEEQNAQKQQEKREYLNKQRAVLQRTSWYYERIPNKDRSKLVNRVKAAVSPGKEPSPLVRALAEIDFTVIITTNYDRLFEKALGKVGKDPIIRIYDPAADRRTKDFPGKPEDPKQPWFFKMHGCISDPDSIVITDEDYINFVMRMGDSEIFHPVPLKMRVQFKDWPTLFVGYSLLDYNLRLLFRTLRRQIPESEQKPSFSLDPHPDILVMETYKGGLVSFIEQDSWKFVPELYRILFDRDMPQ